MRDKKKSTILTTNINFGDWDSVFYDAVVVNEIIDKVLHYLHERKGTSMKRKKYKVFILILLIVCAGLQIFNLSKNKESGKDFEADKYYSVKNEKISINGFDLEIPQIVDMKDENKQQELNEILKNSVKGYFSKISLSSDGIISLFEYSIETKNESKLSILFTYQYYDKNMAHPLISAFATNIDLEKNEIIKLDDFKDRVRLFDKNTFVHVTKRETSLIDDGGILEDKNIDELLQDMDNNNFYFIDDKLGIIFDVPYACGGYSIYEEIN